MFKNKRFFILILSFFTLIRGLQSQRISLDLQKADQLLSLAQERERVASEALEEVKSQRIRLEEDMTDLQDKTNTAAKTEKKKIEASIKSLRKNEEELLAKRKYANNLLLDVTDILQATPKKRAKFIDEYEKRFGVIKVDNTNDYQQVITAAPPSVEPKTSGSDAIAQMEKQASSQDVITPNSDLIAPNSPKTDVKSKKKKESTKKPKPVVQPESAVVEAEKTEVQPKKKKESTKKPKPVVQPESAVAETEKTEAQPKKKKESTKKPKSVTQPDATVAQAKKTESKSKKKKETIKKPPIDAQPDAPIVDAGITETKPEVTEPSPIPQSEVVVTEPEPKTESKKKKKENKPASVRIKSETSKTAVNYKKWDIKDDVMSNTPESLDCQLAFDGVDNFTGKKKQETVPIVLFSHTDDFMRPAMKDKDYVKCEATATRVEGSRIVYLNLTITVQSKEAQRTFGFLDRGALIIFRLINGKKINLPTSKTDIGVVDVDKGTTTFRAQLAIAETVELTQSELDAVRISWSIGYEDYEIYDMDILRNLFKCLDKK